LSEVLEREFGILLPEHAGLKQVLGRLIAAT
jgi:N-hydroxyarylamine O-acetyltransferase